MADILTRLACADSDDLCCDAAAEIRRLRKIETAARALKFSAYPAHGSGLCDAGLR